MAKPDRFLLQHGVRQDKCPEGCDEDFFDEIDEVKFTLKSDVVDTTAGWILNRENEDSKKTCLYVKFLGSDDHVLVSGYHVVSCNATHPYVSLTLQRSDSMREALFINTEVYGMNHSRMRDFWKDSNLAQFVSDTFQKVSNKAGVIQRQVSKLILKVNDSGAKKKGRTSKKDSGNTSAITESGTPKVSEGIRGAPKKVPRGKSQAKNSETSVRKETPNPKETDEDTLADLPSRHNLPTNRNADGTVVAEECVRRFANFEADFGKYYPLGYDTIVDVDVEQVDLAPCNYIVRVLENEGVATVYNTLMTQVIPNKQVLCLYPQGLTSVPKDWNDIKGLRFWAISGQHTVEAAKRIIKNPDVDTPRKELMKTWKAQIVWDPEAWKIQAISEYYNQSNQINPFKPTWASNIVHVRRIWEQMGRPERTRVNASDKSSPEMNKKRADWNVSFYFILEFRRVNLMHLFRLFSFLSSIRNRQLVSCVLAVLHR